jgi:hypothetical protein
VTEWKADWLAPSTISQVLHDVVEVGDGVVVTLLIDSYDVLRFCYPVGTLGDEIERVGLAGVVDFNIAMEQGVFSWPLKPILLREYVLEVKRVFNALRARGTRVYGLLRHLQSGRIGRDFSQLILGDPRPASFPTYSGPVRYDQLTQEDVELAVAIVADVFREGSARLERVLRELVAFEETVHDAWLLGQLHAFRGNTLFVGEVRELFVNEINSVADQPEELDRLERSIEADARAIDKMVQLNAAAKRLSGGRRRRFVYVSSAARTERMMKSGVVSAHIARERLDVDVSLLWRRPEHFMALVAHRSVGADFGLDVERTRRSLQATSAVVRVLEESSERRHVPDELTRREWEARVERLKTRIERRRRHVRNLRVTVGIRSIEERLSKFKQVLTGDATPFRQAKRLEVVLESLRASGFRDWAIEAARDLEIDVLQDAREIEEGIGTHGGWVTVPAQIGPWFVAVESNAAKDIHTEFQRRILESGGEPSVMRAAGTRAYERIQQAADRGLGFDYEWKLLDSVIALTFGNRASDRRALDMVAASADAHRLDERIGVEFLYVASWAARRCREFDSAEGYARLGLQLRPHDGRLWHALSLNAYASYRELGKASRRDLVHACQFAESAIEAFASDARWHPEPFAANLHNLAYCRSVDRADASAFDLRKARDAIDKLKVILPRGKWCAEYQHSEALVEYREWEEMLELDESIVLRCRKLREARRRIQVAVSESRKIEVLSLAGLLDRAYERDNCREGQPDERVSFMRSQENKLSAES